MERNSDRPGFLDATGSMDHLSRLQDATAAEIARVQRVYHEIERRDGAANWHAALWFRFACVLAVVLIVAIAAIVYFAMKASTIQAFVQPVQITDDGKMVLIGAPKDLLDYQPQDADMTDMLSQYVMKRRWRGDDETYKRTRNDWLWLFHHSCGFGSKILANDAIKEHPFTPSTIRASIAVKSITKTATPESWQVDWRETTVDTLASTLKETDYVGTFTVGRVRPHTLSEAMDNHLGICVNGYDFSPKEGR